jgi:PAS domain S-box-containing protein
MKMVKSKRNDSANKYIVLSQLFFILLVGILVLRTSGVSIENYMLKIPEILIFLVLLLSLIILMLKNSLEQKWYPLVDVGTMGVYLIIVNFFLIKEQEHLFKISLMMPVIILGLKYGTKTAFFTAGLSSSSLIIISGFQGFKTIDLDIMLSCINILIAWLLGKTTETEYVIRTELEKEIKERVRAEKALEDQLVLLEELIDTIPNPIFYKDNNQLFLGCNTAFEKLFDLHKKNIIGKNSDQIISEVAAQLEKIDSLLFQNQEKKVCEITIIDSQGENKEFLFYQAGFSSNEGVISGRVGVMVDITKLKKMQRELVRADRLYLVGEMAASIAHEIRNPITTVRGFLQLYSIKDDLADLRKHIDLMVSELDRANTIITEYLALARDRVANLKTMNLNSIVQGVAPLLQADAILCKKGLNLQLGQVPDLLLDESEIRQLLLNLCRNGLEAMTTGGVLNLDTYMEGEEVVLSVKDQGKGIDPELAQKIGTPFITTKEHGTGLGLAVCYSIADRHHALMDFKTGPEGTTFFIRFPYKKQ